MSLQNVNKTFTICSILEKQIQKELFNRDCKNFFENPFFEFVKNEFF